jgi:hypothetical protein
MASLILKFKRELPSLILKFKRELHRVLIYGCRTTTRLIYPPVT